MYKTNLARLALPDKVGFSSAATHIIHFLVDCKLNSSELLVTPFGTYKSADVHKVRVNFSARSALDFESVPEVVLCRIIWPQVGHAVIISTITTSFRFSAYPVKSAVRVRIIIVASGVRFADVDVLVFSKCCWWGERGTARAKSSMSKPVAKYRVLINLIRLAIHHRTQIPSIEPSRQTHGPSNTC